jgi:hypothetical protein
MMSEIKVPTLEIIKCTNSVIADFINDAEKLFENVSGYSDIDDNYKFRNIKVYGNSEEPCFQANCIFDYLFPKYLKNFNNLDEKEKKTRIKSKKNKFTDWIKRNFNKKVIEDDTEVSILNKKLISYANIKRDETDSRYYKSYTLTETGLLTALFSNDSDKTELLDIFRDYLLLFIRNIRKYHTDVYNQERDRSIKELKIKYESERDRRQEAEKINGQNIQLRDAFINPDDACEHQHVELTILRRTAMKQYYVYVVDWQAVNSRWHKSFPTNESKSASDADDDDSDIDDKPKKKRGPSKKSAKQFDDTEPHKDGIYEPYDLYDVDLRTLKRNSTDEYYIYISPKPVAESKQSHFKFLRFIYIHNTTHFKEMMDYIANGKKYINESAYSVNSDLPEIEYIPETVETVYKGVYQLSYSNLMDARNSSFININKQTLVDHKKTKRTKVLQK